MKKIAIVVASEGFKDTECFVPKKIFDDAGMEVTIVSNRAGTARGADGGTIDVDFKLSDFDVTDFDAVVFVGGPGALENLDNEESYNTARDAVAKEKLLAAICISPVILAKAGVLIGKNATVWTSSSDKSPAGTLEERGATYVDEPVVEDGKIITGSGPAAAEEFGKKIVAALG